MCRILFFGVMLVTYNVVVQATVLTIDSQTNIFLASQTGSGGGLTPIATNFSPGSNLTLKFLSVTGTTNCCSGSPSLNTSPDGIGGFGSTNINSSGGISGIVSPGSLFLAGLFVNSSSLPSGIAPNRLNFFSIGTNFITLSPLLSQSFFIGDGLSGNGVGTTQQFLVPSGANTLYLGFLDGFGFSGNPGFYNDNTGSLDVSFDITAGTPSTSVPEPTTIVLLGLGLTGLLIRRRSCDVRLRKDSRPNSANFT